MKKKSIFMSCLFLSSSMRATEASPWQHVKHNFDLSGYINYKAFYDTRQLVAESDEQTLFYPRKKMRTPTGDINAKGQGQMLPIETRVRGTLHGPDIGNNVHEKGVIEVEFKGSHEVVNLVNMRHAYGQLDWNDSTFLFGQTWHPLNVIELIPNTVSFNSGRPFAVYNRSPMAEYTYHAPHLDIIMAAASQVDFTSDGPIGLDAQYMREAVIPNLHFQLKGFVHEHVIGTGIDYQRIAPRISSVGADGQLYKVREPLSSLAGIWYAALNWSKISIRNTLMFGGNLSNYGLIGGYAVQKGSINPITGKRKYTTTRTLSGWSDWTIIPTHFFEIGWFIGAEKNYGSHKKIEHDLVGPDGVVIERRIFGLGNDLNTVVRFSPRMRFKVKQVTFALEVEYTRAAFGNTRITPDGLNDYGRAIDPIPVANTQVLFSTFLFF